MDQQEGGTPPPAKGRKRKEAGFNQELAQPVPPSLPPLTPNPTHPFSEEVQLHEKGQ